MSVTTLLGYWFGRRKAILQIARTPGAAWLGLVFVFSAVFAREYDGEDLLAAPWHLFLPLGASLVLSGVLFGLVTLLARWKGATQGTILGPRMVQDPYNGLLNHLSPGDLDRYLSIIETLPEGLKVVGDHPESFRQILNRDDRSDSQHERVRALLEASGHPAETVEDTPE